MCIRDSVGVIRKNNPPAADVFAKTATDVTRSNATPLIAAMASRTPSMGELSLDPPIGSLSGRARA
jgi:hypothetical protein